MFWVDCGQTGSTSGSTYVRSELREQLTPGHDTPTGAPHGTHIMTARLRVKASTADPAKVTVLQIHGYARRRAATQGLVAKWCALAVIKTDDLGAKRRRVPLGSVVGNNFFNAEVRVENRKLTITIDGARRRKPGARTIRLSHENYFKAGAYPASPHRTVRRSREAGVGAPMRARVVAADMDGKGVVGNPLRNNGPAI